MIVFKDGKYLGGTPSELFEFSKEENETLEIWNRPFKEKTYLMIIPKKGNIKFYSSYQLDRRAIPPKTQTDWEDYGLFWDSQLTMVFSTVERAIEEMKAYKDFRKEEVEGLSHIILDSVNLSSAKERCGHVPDFEEKHVEAYDMTIDYVKSKVPQFGLDLLIETLKHVVTNFHLTEILMEQGLDPSKDEDYEKM